MWTHLEPHSVKLEQVFEPLRTKAAQYGHAWSIAELRLPEDDVTWLRSWLGCITPESTENWINSVMLAKYEGDAFATYRQMFGSLLICAGAEACREESREDSVWPAIRSILPESHALRRELFLSNGQPSPLTKDVIADAVRALNLRHAMDIEGSQQWFVTIKLQFGFTYRGAKNRLAEWLVNLGRPHAVQYLDGDSDFPELVSKSFQSLWRTLTQYRRGLIKESEVRTTLQRNPWIKAHWIDDLLKEAKARISTLGTGEWHKEEIETHGEEVSREEFCPIAGIALEWSQGRAPRLRFHIDRKAIENEVNETVGELDFYVDGKKLCRWLRQQNGSWAGVDHIYAEPEKYYDEQPNLNPRTLAVLSGSGESLAEWDFADSGLSEEILVFDLERERTVKASAERLEPNGRYAIVCDRKCELQGCDPVETYERNRISRKAIRLPSPLDENLCITYEDFVLWQPVKAESDQHPRFSLTLTTPRTKILSLNDRSELFFEGLPEDTVDCELLIHRKMYEFQRVNGLWRTLKEVMITPELAARQRRVRVRFLSGGRPYTREPRLAFGLLGAAMLRHKKKNDAETVSFDILKKGEELNRSEGTTNLRIWTPEQGKATVVFEGDCRVGRLRHQKIRLRDFPGHGGELRIISHGERQGLGVTCFDTGCVHSFHPPMLGCDAQMFLLSDKNPAEASDDGYILYMWFVGENHKAKFRKVPVASIQPTSRDRVWKIRYSSNPMAIALTWKGSWLGAWWSLESIQSYIDDRNDLPKYDFAIMKWLRVPIVYPTLSPAVKKAVLNAPCRFIKTWRYESAIPEDLRPHDHILGLDSVVRYFLWNHFPPGHAKEVIALLTQGDGNWYQENRCIGHLTELADISPILLWKGMEQCLTHNCNNIIHLLEVFTRAQVGLPSSAARQHLNFRLREVEKRALSATGIYEDRLEEIISERIESLMEKRWHPSEQDCMDLLKLGETHSGRKYLSARMGQYWLNLSRK